MNRSRKLTLLSVPLFVAAMLLVPQPAAAIATFTTTLVNSNGGNCMALPGGSTADAVQLTQQACTGAAYQQFTFTPVSGTTDTYTIATVASKCVDVFGASTADNATIIQWGCHSNPNQRWKLNPVTVSGTDKTFNLLSVGSSKCVVPAGGASTVNTGLVQLPCSTATSRIWRLAGFTSGGTTVTVANPGSRSTAVNTATSLTLSASGGTTYTWAATGLPAGLSINSATGVISGTPTTVASYSVTATATSAGVSGSATFTWTITSGGSTNTFTNPLKQAGPDPWLQYYNGYYYLATTTWNRTITMRRATTLRGLATATDQVLFNLTNPNGAGTMWAPEFHLLSGPNGQRWYFYYTAGREPYDLGTQRIHVLESAGLDPMGPYTFKADLLDPTADNTWELDPGILQLNGNLYLLGTFYNGSQPLFIRPLSNPWTASGTRRTLVTPTLSWETVGGAVAEGGEVIQRNGKTFIVYSTSHCSTPDYKLGMITYNGTGDPLLASSWTKSPNPVFQRSNANSVYGPGHNGFFKSPDGTEDWIVYHGNSSVNGGCDINRSTRAQKITWNADGTPNLGTPVALGTTLTAPSGEPAS
ncbi:GH43 family beta-xylosidase [Allocatelliglobosispora scoriae]|uniref:GH43 family beta-xylosidase n=1 Tax=Allocatelliglobosispora scoriae TaxID=643052 RepID=A0A841C371_9ACTN|nr:family 43 glycosylhydrolase [Allocatelliglobosispora scoriae]MBB5873583.1 GH43 family beta-xylosidase [Allocatelliglobosispora scoriae]